MIIEIAEALVIILFCTTFGACLGWIFHGIWDLEEENEEYDKKQEKEKLVEEIIMLLKAAEVKK